jgi:hypothetical protein
MANSLRPLRARVLRLPWLMLLSLAFVLGASRPGGAQPADCAVLLARPALKGCEARFANPGHDAIAVKTLTREQARNTVVWLHLQGRMTLNAQSAPRFDASCNLVAPRPSEQLSMKWCFRGPKGILEYKADIYSPPARDSFHGVDPRLAVGMYRLAALLNEGHGAKEIWHRGIVPGGNADSVIHNEGRGIDFSGILKPNGTSIVVLKHWSSQRSFFAPLYSYLVEQYCDGGTTGKLGENSQVVTPSHPTPAQRAGHQDHMHFDIPKGPLCPGEQAEIE